MYQTARVVAKIKIIKNRLTKNKTKRKKNNKQNYKNHNRVGFEKSMKKPRLFTATCNCNFFYTLRQTKKTRVHKQSICSYNFFLDLKRSIFSIVYLIELIRFVCRMDTTTHALPEWLAEEFRRHLGLSLGWSQFRE